MTEIVSYMHCSTDNEPELLRVRQILVRCSYDPTSNGALYLGGTYGRNDVGVGQGSYEKCRTYSKVLICSWLPAHIQRKVEGGDTRV
jgi:hypothetical protein